jgi:hypothetical protein
VLSPSEEAGLIGNVRVWLLRRNEGDALDVHQGRPFTPPQEPLEDGEGEADVGERAGSIAGDLQLKVPGQWSRLRRVSSGRHERASRTVSSSEVSARRGQWLRWPCSRVRSVAAW